MRIKIVFDVEDPDTDEKIVDRSQMILEFDDEHGLVPESRDGLAIQFRALVPEPDLRQTFQDTLYSDFFSRQDALDAAALLIARMIGINLKRRN